MTPRLTPRPNMHMLARRGRPLRLIVTGGGTGGHTYPAITTVHATRALLEAAGIGLDVLYVGSAAGLEARVAVQEQIPFQAVSTGKLRRSTNPIGMISAENLRDGGRAARGVLEAHRIVRDYRPDLVLATGGYVAVPVGIAAATVGAPLVVHEQTTRLGLANRLLVRRATTIALSSPASVHLLPAGARARAVVTGNPVRAALFTGDRQRVVQALDWAGWDPALPTVYVTGGAQGSTQINELIEAILEPLLHQANVVHQTGKASLNRLRQRAADLPTDLAARYQLLDFVGPELPDVLALADVVVSRSGAGTLAELTALGKPSILIPLVPSGGNEQTHNARHLHQAGAAHALLTDHPAPHDLLQALGPVLTDEQMRAAMANHAAQLGRPHAADDLAAVLVDLAVASAEEPAPQ